MAARALTTCDQCGQTDDHPKVHLAGVGEGRTVHNDCLSRQERDMVFGSSDVAAKIVEAAEGGTHGDKLLTHIEKLHKEG